jgi:hypothetical protein
MRQPDARIDRFRASCAIRGRGQHQVRVRRSVQHHLTDWFNE